MTAVVLVVDEDVKVLRLLEATLRLKDFEVVKSESAAEALEWLRSGQPDLVISDTDVPDLDGFDLFRRVRGMPAHTDVPFIFLSADGEPEDVARGLRAGADEYLRKPFAIDELLVRVVRVLERGAQPDRERLFSGQLIDMSLPDLLRMLSVQRSTGLLEVQPAQMEVTGLFQVTEGRLTHGEFGLLTGEPALFAALAHTRGRFVFDPTTKLAGDTIAGPTLPLLMEGLGLVDSGGLPRIDPRSIEAVRTFSRMVRERRRPAIDDSRGDENPLRLEDGRPPGVFTGSEVGTLESVEFDETQQLRALTEELEGPTFMDEDSVGLDSAEFAAVFLTGEIEALEAEADGRRIWEEPTERFVSPMHAPSEPQQLTGQILIAPPEDDDESAIALIDDTFADLDINNILNPRTSGISGEDVMEFYEAVKGTATRTLGAASVQLGTRTGRVIASSIPEVTRRDTVAQFSSQAIMFANEAPDGTSFASLDAGDLHVLVLEVDHLRVLTLLFNNKPDPVVCLDALSTDLDGVRGAR